MYVSTGVSVLVRVAYVREWEGVRECERASGESVRKYAFVGVCRCMFVRRVIWRGDRSGGKVEEEGIEIHVCGVDGERRGRQTGTCTCL